MDKIFYSKTNDPTRWANGDYDVIKFATPEDAKKAEVMFNRLLDFVKKACDVGVKREEALALLRQLRME